MTAANAARAFVDTNVLVYAFDQDEPEKRDTARALLTRRDRPVLVLSTQVLAEFYVTVTRKLGRPLDPGVAADVVAEFAQRPVVPTDAILIRAAISLSREHGLSLWDALIVEAAAVSGCEILLTEDLDSGAVLHGVRVENPFV